MTASTQRPTTYTVSDLQHVMRNVEADSWDDVIDQLQRPAPAVAALPPQAAAEMSADLETLKQEATPFTTDYRRIWQELTGEHVNGSDLRAPDADAGGAAEYDVDGSTSSSSRVLDLLHRLESKEYQQMASDLQRFGDHGWKRD